MNVHCDQDLLREYAERGAEAAFAELVRRYVDFTYTAAFRMVRNTQLAEEVTQSVFVALSQNAWRLTNRPVLSGWLHRTARNLAAKTVRTEVRRRAREQEAARMNELSVTGSEAWEEIAPQLDAALNELRETDRDMVLLRFFHHQSSREIGASFGLSEEAAKKRVARAVERLRGILLSRGVAVSAAALGAALSANSVQAAPAGLAAAALAGASAASAASTAISPFTAFLKGLAMTKLQANVLGLLFVAGVATPVILDSRASVQAAKSFQPPPQTALGTTNTRTPGHPAPAAADMSTLEANTPLGRLAAWVQRLDRTHQPYEPWSFDQEELDYLIWSLPLADYPKAWRLGDGLRQDEIKNHLQNHILSYWAELDPRAALAAAATSDSSWSRPAPAIEVLQTWARKEPLAALGWVQQSVPDGKKGLVLASVLPEAARANPQAALAGLTEISSDLRRERVRSEILRQWAQQSPMAAAGYVTNLPASSARRELMKHIATGLAEKDPERALDWSQSLPSASERKSTLEGALFAMVESHPAQAAAALDKLEGEALQTAQPYLGNLLENWAKADLPAAAEWTRKVWAGIHAADASDAEKRRSDWALLDHATGKLLKEWSSQNPREAAEFALALPGEESPLVQNVLAKWSTRDSQGAWDYASGLAPGPARDAAIKGVCEGLASSDPQQAAEFVANLPPGQVQSEAAVGVVYSWAINDPKAAAQWVAAFPEGETRRRAAERLMTGWIDGQGDLQSAVNWLGQLPAGATRNQAVQAFVMGAAWKAPELAAPWVNAFTDEARRNQQIEQIARRWLITDPDAARQWLASTALPEVKKEQLLGK